MVPTAEHPFQGGGYSLFDRPVATADMVGSEHTHQVHCELLDPDAASVEHLWDLEDSFLDTLQSQVAELQQRLS